MAMQFQGFKPEAMQRIAGTLGYNGDMSKFNGYLEANPEAKQKMDMYSQQAVNMMNGGMATKDLANGGYMDRLQGSKQQFNAGLTNSAGERIYQGAEVNRGRNNRNRTAPLLLNQRQVKPLISDPAVSDPKDIFAVSDPSDPKNIFAVSDPAVSNPAVSDPAVSDPDNTLPQIKKDTINRMKNPTLPTGANVTATGTVVQGNQLIDAYAGNVSNRDPEGKTRTAYASSATATDPRTQENLVGRRIYSEREGQRDFRDDQPRSTTDTGVFKTDTVKSGDRIEGELDKTTAVEGTVSEGATVGAEQTTESSVSDLTTTEGMSIDVKEVADRKMEIGERVDPVADAASAATFTEEIQAATATPSAKATVKGQLAELMTDFEGGKTPPWAAGSMRAATAAMAARGLSSSSMAGQAIVQATMEAALPIASVDAGTFAKFESQNLSNRQQRAMLAAEQRATFMGQEFDQKFQARVANASKVSDIANMNFTAEQQVALENSRAANTMALANLSNDQAVVMAEAAALSSLDLASLNNRQQAEVINSQNLMQMDMANLSNTQQTNIFKAQQRVQSLFSDKAAENAANQFNATSENQTDQFFANLKTQTSQFNTSQKNAQEQFNAGEENTQERFTKEMMNQREQFNANNKVAIDQSNAVWRREVATANTAAINRSNEVNASALLDMSNTAYNNTWQYYADTMENAYTATNNERDRMTKLAVAKLEVDSSFDIAKWQADATSSAAVGAAIVKIATTDFNGSTALEKAWDWWNKT